MRTVSRSEIDDAYRTCERITWAEARNFAYGIRLLSTPKRRMLSAVYAFARRIDDIGDGELPVPEKLAALDVAEREITGSPAATGDPVLVALDDATRHGLDLAPFAELIDGCRDDVMERRYDGVEELYDYCRKVAGSVGRLSLDVFGTSDPDRARPLADALGVALQLTNILRDVLEDAQQGRVYLPAEDRARFGCRFELDANGRFTDPPADLARLVAFESRRARQWYERGLALLPLLDRRSAASCSALAGVYLRLLHLIESDPVRVIGGRTSVPLRAKLGVVARSVAGGAP